MTSMRLQLNFIILTLCCMQSSGDRISLPTQKQLATILASMDNSTDACEDFYTHACGNWAEQHANEDYGISNMMQTIYVNEIDDVMLKEYPMDQQQFWRAQQNVTEKALAYYYSCFRIKDSLNEFKFLDLVKPGPRDEWPLLEEAKLRRKAANRFTWTPTENFNLFALVGELNGYGINNELIKTISLYLENGTLVTILAKPDLAGIDVDEIKVVVEESGVRKIAVNRLVREIQQTHDYWQAVYKNFTKTEKQETEDGEDDDDDDLTFSYEELQKDSPRLYAFISKAIPLQLRDEASVVGLTDVKYFKSLLAKQWQQEEVRKLCNYLMVKFVLSLKRAHGYGCNISVVNHMPFAFHALYYQHRFLPYASDFNRDINAMTRKIFKYIMEIINENHLKMTAKQLRTMRKRFQQMSINLGNLPTDMNYEILEKLYSDIPDLDVNNYYENHLKVKRHNVLEQLACPSNLSCRDDPDHIPYYERLSNMMTIPFGTLKPPMYDISFDPLLSLSTLGTILGHELAHVVDTTTLSMSYPIFEQVLQQPEVGQAMACMQGQHPTSTIDERIADLLGARVAFQTYKREYSLRLQPQFTSIPWNRLFFLNLAQFFCTKNQDFDNEHDSSLIRLNQIAMNLKEFSEAFQCPLGSKLNPERRCRFY
ncbi:endothelin-converting enzyme homolog [Stomoxys calcitrans]|uniref:endothelin-converting enzyme homolog n=1 Tax=Stomoxys calcitrans TaxID=35570 RepID=UPI0027E2352D|nr:endothelin-converting enzyme homolog [Stomoxys calcitrans]XP_059220745.1 endothelin-converting enzyme homolog [Stomoxys calcitrans]